MRIKDVDVWQPEQNQPAIPLMNNVCVDIPPLSFSGGCSGINSKLQNTYKKQQDWGFDAIVRGSWFILRISALNHS